MYMSQHKPNLAIFMDKINMQNLEQCNFVLEGISDNNGRINDV